MHLCIRLRDSCWCGHDQTDRRSTALAMLLTRNHGSSARRPRSLRSVKTKHAMNQHGVNGVPGNLGS
jgi:hypothetical protein